jgi:hypothetical protein
MLQALMCSLQGGAEPLLRHSLPQRDYLLSALAAAQAVDAGGIATDTAQAHPGQPQRIAHAIHAARLAAVKTLAVRNESSL